MLLHRSAGALEELQSNVCHWETLRLAFLRSGGPDDPLTKFYAAKVQECRTVAAAIGFAGSLDHLVAA